jgi:hypothetical protein
MKNATRRVGVAIAAAGLLVSLPLEAQAKSGSGRVRTVSAYTNFVDSAAVFSPSLACPGPDCGLEAHYITALNGPGVYGYEEATLFGFPDPAHPGVLAYHGTAVFHVTKSLCGTGTFTEIVTEGTLDYSNIDPSTQTVPAHDTWTIISGSGTGQLVGIEGTGTDDADTEDFTVDELLNPNGGSRGVHDGTLTCRLHG